MSTGRRPKSTLRPTATSLPSAKMGVTRASADGCGGPTSITVATGAASSDSRAAHATR